MEKVLPTVMIVIDVLTSVPYFYQGNWRMGLYWLFVAGITVVLTY